MTEPQIIRTPSGEELVVLPRGDYDRLVAAAAEAAEDDADIAMFDARMQALAAGRDEILPPAVSQAVLRGASLLRALRSWRDVSQTTLAQEAGIGQGYLSDMECGRRAGAPETLLKLAKALAVPATWLLPAAQDAG